MMTDAYVREATILCQDEAIEAARRVATTASRSLDAIDSVQLLMIDLNRRVRLLEKAEPHDRVIERLIEMQRAHKESRRVMTDMLGLVKCLVDITSRTQDGSHLHMRLIDTIAACGGRTIGTNNVVDLATRRLIAMPFRVTLNIAFETIKSLCKQVDELTDRVSVSAHDLRMLSDRVGEN